MKAELHLTEKRDDASCPCTENHLTVTSESETASEEYSPVADQQLPRVEEEVAGNGEVGVDSVGKDRQHRASQTIEVGTGPSSWENNPWKTGETSLKGRKTCINNTSKQTVKGGCERLKCWSKVSYFLSALGHLL